MNTARVAARTDPARHPLFERLTGALGYSAPDVEGFDAVAARAGHTLLFFAEDPERFKETLDLAVILPEIANAFPGALEAVVLLPAVAPTVAKRYGVRRWPALVMLRDGRYVGAVEGLRDWQDYLFEVSRLLEIEPSDPPGAEQSPPTQR